MEKLGSRSAWIDGNPVDFIDAVRLAANLLQRSRQAAFFGMGTDIAGARAAITLAERIGAVVDHAHSASLLRNLDCMREDGVMLTTPAESHLRADLVLLVGRDPGLEWQGLHARLFRSEAFPDVEGMRKIVWLAPDAASCITGFCGSIEIIEAGEGTTLAMNLAALRAALKGRLPGREDFQHLVRLADRLALARFGVAVWSAQGIDFMTLEMLNGLVRDLNETTRFSTLPLPPPDNAVGVLQATAWMTGFPPCTGFGLGWPEHDPWRFDAERLLTCGEADCALWISALGSPPQIWPTAAPVIAVCGPEHDFATPPRVRFAVGRPGIDHDAVLHDLDVGTLVAVAASSPSSALSVAETLQAIGAHLDTGGPLAC